MNARIWLGFHFRTAMTDGNALGHAVADYAATHPLPADRLNTAPSTANGGLSPRR